jgi:flagellar basal body rod protein FlgG
MLDLMTLSRQFESLSRVLQNYDEALGRVIEKLGEG